MIAPDFVFSTTYFSTHSYVIRAIVTFAFGIAILSIRKYSSILDLRPGGNCFLLISGYFLIVPRFGLLDVVFKPSPGVGAVMPEIGLLLLGEAMLGEDDVDALGVLVPVDVPVPVVLVVGEDGCGGL